MLPRHRLVLTAVALTLVVFSLFQFQSASAVIGTVSVSPNPVTNPDPAIITVEAQETAGAGRIHVLVESGEISIVACTAGADPCLATFVSGQGTAEVIVEANDANGTDIEDIILRLAYAPPTVSENTDIDVFTCQDGSAACNLPSSPDTTVEVRPTTNGTPTRTSGGTGGNSAGDMNIRVTASPNIVPCGGGLVELEAKTVFSLGGATARMNVRYTFTTNYGDLVQTSNDRAILSIKPGMLPEGVAEVVVYGGDGNSETLLIREACSDIATVVVTAAPNVVQCGGSSKLTATARDRSGHVVPGVGFHFSTDQGLLEVGPPNTAAELDGEAVLKISPGMTQATVLVSVGETLGSFEGQVTVQQFCPTSSTTPGMIALTASKNTVSCGGSTFIAALVRDVSGNPVKDDTAVTFLTDSGRFGAGSPAGAATASASSTPTVPQPSTQPAPSTTSGTNEKTLTTVGGAVNVVYVADALTGGTAHITVAGGASFGSIDLQIDCSQQLGYPGVGGVATSGGGSAVAGARSCSAGVVCISPPNTGEAGLTIVIVSADWPPTE